MQSPQPVKQGNRSPPCMVLGLRRTQVASYRTMREERTSHMQSGLGINIGYFDNIMKFIKDRANLKSCLYICKQQQNKLRLITGQYRLIDDYHKNMRQLATMFNLILNIDMFLKIVVVCVLLVLMEGQATNRGEEVANQQNNIRAQNNMTYTNVKSYTFVCGRFDDFIIKPSVSKEIKYELHTYWKQENVYVSAEYREGQEIRVIIYQDNQRVLLDRQFYITTGFSFSANKGSTYTIRFLAAGSVTKLISMISSSPIQISEDLAKKEHIGQAQMKVESIDSELKALLTISQRNFLMKQQVASKILSNSQLYMGYEIFEVILIIGVAVYQVLSMNKLLTTGSVV